MHEQIEKYAFKLFYISIVQWKLKKVFKYIYIWIYLTPMGFWIYYKQNACNKNVKIVVFVLGKRLATSTNAIGWNLKNTNIFRS